MKKNLFLTGAVAALVLAANVVWAQGPGGPPLPVAVPVDAGISLLLAAGAAFGARSLRKR